MNKKEFIPREIDPIDAALVGEEAMKRLKDAVANIQPLSEEAVKSFSDAEELSVCKYCGRCVMIGPPCCYQLLNDMYQKVLSENEWLRKIQSKKDKKINELLKELDEVKNQIP